MRLWKRSLAVSACLLPSIAMGATFVDRVSPQSLRVAAWNVYNDSPFDTTSVRRLAFNRVLRSVSADVWALQEF